MVNAPQPRLFPSNPVDPVTPLSSSRDGAQRAYDDMDALLPDTPYRHQEAVYQHARALLNEARERGASSPEYHRYNHLLNSFLLQQQLQNQQHHHQHQLLQQHHQDNGPSSQQRQYYYTSPQHASHSHNPSNAHSLQPSLQGNQQQVQRRSDPHHRVYVIYCAHCDTFLSNRGMRAVLLLKPHITLFSTDATPSNCGTLYSEEDEHPSSEDDRVERTCDCLTQSLGCHGCGSVVGYQIIAPCERCTASVARHQRPANGHRYVFHHDEVVHTERKYYPGEKSIKTDLVRHISHSERVAERERAAAAQAVAAAAESAGDLSDSSVGAATTTVSTSPRMAPQPAPIDLDSKEGRERLIPLQFSASRDSTRSATPLSATRAAPAARPPRSPYGLEEGDTVYWHYLVSGGELTKPVDPRTRIPICFSVGR